MGSRAVVSGKNRAVIRPYNLWRLILPALYAKTYRRSLSSIVIGYLALSAFIVGYRCRLLDTAASLLASPADAATRYRQ